MAHTSTQQIRKIPLGRPVFDQLESDAVAHAMKSPWILNGPEVRKFEDCYKTYTGCTHAASVSSCTAGIHLALAALGLKSGDEVLLPSFNFIAAGLSVLQAGGRPVFIDSNLKTGNLDPDDFEKKITARSKAVLVLHYSGYPAELDLILAIAKQHKLAVIEDAAHALGAEYQGKKIGSFGDATVFSFGPLKMISTGMGGMVTSNNPALIKKIEVLRSYGMDKSMWDRQTADKPWSYSVTDLGHNFRMTDIQAATGLVQMDKLSKFIEIRRKIAAAYDAAFKQIPEISFFEPAPNSNPVPLYYAMKIKSGAEKRDALGIFLIQQGVGASVHWDMPLHKHPLFRNIGCGDTIAPRTDELCSQVLSLPLHPAMTEDDTAYIIEKVKEFFRGNANAAR